MVQIPLVGATFLALTFATAAPAQEPTVPFVLQRLDMALTVNFSEHTIDGSAVLQLRNYTSGPVARVPLQVGRLMEVTNARDAAGNSLKFTQDVVRFSDWPARQMDQVWIELPAALAAGQSTSVEVKWNGTLTPYTETGMLYVRERIDSAFTILREETGAFPVVGVPSRAAMRKAPREDFEYHVRVTVPAYEVAALGGRLVSRTTNGSSVTYEYQSRGSAPFVNIPVAPYGLLQRDGVRVYYLRADSVGAASTLLGATRGLSLLAEWFGPMGDTLDLAIMEIPSGYGSQSNLRSGIIQSAAAFQNKERLGELYHELSHLWNAPLQDRPSPRWEEGLASFLEELMAEKIDGAVNAQAAAQKYASTVVQRFGRDTANQRLAFADYGRAGKTDYSYSVGHLLFSVLYETLGQENFNRAVGGYYQQYRLTGATTRQFVDYVKQHSPYDLSELFNDWMYTTKWYDRLKQGETIQRMAATYRKAT